MTAALVGQAGATLFQRIVSAISRGRLLVELIEDLLEDTVFGAGLGLQLGDSVVSMNLAPVDDADAVGEPLGHFEDLRRVEYGPAALGRRAGEPAEGGDPARIHAGRKRL